VDLKLPSPPELAYSRFAGSDSSSPAGALLATGEGDKPMIHKKKSCRLAFIPVFPRMPVVQIIKLSKNP
jgi:hypothetical protein